MVLENLEIDGQPLVAACSLLMPEGIYFLGKQGVFCYSYAEKKMIRCKFKESPFEFSPNYVYLYDEKERKVILSFLEKGYGTCVVYPQREYPLHVYRFIQENMGGYL